ncbi:MAG: branched-chain amino acid ABC transporter permease [Nitrososphaerota archaeon]
MLDIVITYFLNGIFFASILFLIASGLTLIFSVAGIVNLTHGCLYMIGAYLVAVLIKATPNPIFLPLTFILAALLVGILGLIIERSLIKWVYERAEEYQLLLTHGLSFVLMDFTRIVFGSEPISSSEPFIYAGIIDILGRPYPLYNIIVIIVSFFVGIFLWLFLYKTKLGMYIRACSLNREMSSALGINTNLIFPIIFLIGSILGGLSGALILPPTVAMLGMNADALIQAFIVITIGGLGSIKGALIGSLIIGIIRAFGIVYIPEIELAIIYLVMAAVLIVRPRGLFGKEYRVV